MEKGENSRGLGVGCVGRREKIRNEKKNYVFKHRRKKSHVKVIT